MGLAHGAEPAVFWTPGVAELGHQGLVSGEFDGHPGLDWVASYAASESTGLAMRLSGTEEDWFVVPQEAVGTLRLRVGQWDDDSEEEVLIGLPDYGAGGAVGILDLSSMLDGPSSVEDAASIWIEGAEAGASFGWDLMLSDCHSTSGAELLVSAPQSRLDGTVYAFGTEGDAVALGNWTVKWTTGNRFGMALSPFSTSGQSQMLVGSCDFDADTMEACASNGQIFQVSLEECESTVSLEDTQGVVGGLLGPPTRLLQLTEDSFGADSGVLWSTPGSKPAVSMTDPDLAFEVLSVMDSGAVLQNEEEGVTQTWVASSGKVWKIPGDLSATSVEATSNRMFEASTGDGLGLSLSWAGDQDEDGCDDLLSASSAGESLWLLGGCEPDPEDTGTPDTGTPDTGTPDTGTPDTGTPDTGTPDTGDDECQSDFGWRCASGPAKSQYALIWLLVGLICLNRRAKTD